MDEIVEVELVDVARVELREALTHALEQAAQSLYAAAAAQTPPAGHAADAGGQAGGAAPNDEVVDAEFTEVKDDGKK